MLHQGFLRMRSMRKSKAWHGMTWRMRRRRRRMLRKRRKRKRAEQWQGFPGSGEGPLEGGVRRPTAASWSYLLRLLSLRFLSLTTRGGRPDESESWLTIWRRGAEHSLIWKGWSQDQTMSPLLTEHKIENGWKAGETLWTGRMRRGGGRADWGGTQEGNRTLRTVEASNTNQLYTLIKCGRADGWEVCCCLSHTLAKLAPWAATLTNV